MGAARVPGTSEHAPWVFLTRCRAAATSLLRVAPLAVPPSDLSFADPLQAPREAANLPRSSVKQRSLPYEGLKQRAKERSAEGTGVCSSSGAQLCAGTQDSRG